MSHRIYIYNIAHPSEAKKSDVMLTEWGYETPLLLQSLLVDGGFLAGNNYNNHFDHNNKGLYFNAKPGIGNFKKLYALIESHQEGLIDDLPAFLSAKEKLFSFLDRLRQAYFHLDTWDVFNMNDESHENQATQLLNDIQQNNAVFAKAILADDVSLLDFNAFTREATLGFNSFKELLNYPDYNYGWAHIYEEYEDEPDIEIYKENELWGLKSAEGNVLVAPYFDEFYAFEIGTTAVVSKAGKFGYINKAGKIIIPLIYDDAFDFDGDFAVIKIEDKFGLINSDGRIKLAPAYDNIYPIGKPGSFYCAELETKFGVIDACGKTILPFNFDNKFEGETWDKLFYVKENGRGDKLVYSHLFTFLGRFNPKFIEAKDLRAGKSILYEIKKHKYAEVNQLLSAAGEVLIYDFEKISQFYQDGFLVRKNKKYGLYNEFGLPILPLKYDAIEDLMVMLDVLPKNFFSEIPKSDDNEPCYAFKITENNKSGLYVKVGGFNDISISAIYSDLKYIKNEFFALRKDGKWAIFDITGKIVTDFQYDELISVISFGGIAYGLKEGKVYKITNEDVSLANKMHLQDYVDANGAYGYYYFTTDIQRKIQTYIDND
ncbi:MAG: hypothetical protein EOO86_03420 [Pedobacter sp.]|nr:MAG: hypothetical protein EOO86_03420 [Pedobacter sp.]